jgi:hypothetical protein
VGEQVRLLVQDAEAVDGDAAGDQAVADQVRQDALVGLAVADHVDDDAGGAGGGGEQQGLAGAQGVADGGGAGADGAGDVFHFLGEGGDGLGGVEAGPAGHHLLRAGA